LLIPLLASGSIAAATGTAAGANDPFQLVRLTEDARIANSDVRTIIQDQQGFLWFGLRVGGLARYDGYDIKIYEHDENDPRSIGNRVIWSLLVDRQGRLWVATEGGLDLYDRTTDSFIHYRHDPDRADSLPHNVVVSLFEDASGLLWAGTRRGLARLDDATEGRFTTYLRPQVLPGSHANDTFRSIMEDPTTGLLWLGTSDGLAAFDPRTGAFITYLHDPDDPTSISRSSVNQVLRDDRGLFWALTEGGLNSFQPTFDRIDRHAVQEPALTFHRYHHVESVHNPGVDFIRDGVIDHLGRLWLASRGGLHLFDRATASFRTFRRYAGDPHSLNDNLVHTVYRDRADNLWIGSYGGVNVLRAHAKPFQVHRHVPGNPRSLSEDRVTALTFDASGHLWVATANGLNRLDEAGWTRFLHDLHLPGSIPSNMLSSLAVTEEGELWIGSSFQGLIRLNSSGFRSFSPATKHTPAQDGFYEFTGSQINSMLPDRKGGLWIGARAYGVDYYRDGRFQHFRPLQLNVDGTDRPIVNAIFGALGENGSVWFATEGGRLFRFEPDSGTFTSFTAPTRTPGTTRSFLCVADGLDGTIWLGAADGLLRFDTRTETFVAEYGMPQGLPNPAVVVVVPDHRGRVWAGTANGLVELDPRTGATRVFEKPDGLPSNVFSERAGRLGPDGRIYFGTRAGVVSFRPEDLHGNPRPPPVVFTELRWLGTVPEHAGNRAQHTWTVPDTIRVPPGQLGFTLSFSALDYTAPEKNSFRYRLVGWEDEWVPTSAAVRSATYTALPPGTYTFRVQASNADGVWNEEGSSVTIVVEPKLWQTTWFRLGLGLLLLSLVIAAYRWRLRGIRRRNALLENQVSQRTSQLQQEVQVRQQAEKALRESHAELESRVQQRTAELARANVELQAEIAERHNVEAQLRQSQKMEAIGQLAGGVAHDFNNLLTVILGQIDLMQSTDMPADMRAEAMRDITAAAQRASNLTRQLLVFSRQQAMNPNVIDVNRVVSDLGKLLNHVIGEHISFETSTAPHGLSVLGDAGMLEQVLLNMAINARDAMPRGGQLRITTSGPMDAPASAARYAYAQAGPYVCVSVSDTGFGIPEDVLPKIFEPFFTTKDSGKGTGLGLAISLDIIQQHGGWIDVESWSGQGTTFHVYLPIHHAPVPLAPRLLDRVNYAKGDTTILLAEDESAVRNVVRTVLTRQGYRVIETASGRDALVSWAQHRDEITLLVTDIVMPGEPDGHELAAQLLAEKPSLRVVTMSGYDPSEVRAVASALPSRTHLRKPFAADDLLRVVEAALRPVEATVVS
jgi:signal transduction histidine kinase/ligand-binding sensor domain-containing protein/ActR/RegA family two-component response regulator